MIVIIGADHRLQRQTAQILSTSEALLRIEREQKEHFVEILQEYISKPGRWFVGEEIECNTPTFALGRTLSPNLYRNIDMPRRQREAEGIPLDYAEEGAGGKYTTEQIQSWNRQRERFMFEEIQQHRENADNVLVVCGALHAQPLAALFQSYKEEVEVRDLRDEKWFVADWLKAYMAGPEL